METPTSFGLWIRQQRRILDLTQGMLAERIGCSLSAIRKIEADERRPSREIADLLADALQIDAKDRPTFLKVARGELRTERLAAVESISTRSPLPSPSTPPSVLVKRHSNLPTSLTPLIGRVAELTKIKTLLTHTDCRLLTLVGAGGSGKTSLALAVAQSILEEDKANAPTSPCPDGVFFVALASLAAPEYVVSTLASALGFTFAGAGEPQQQLLDYLRTRAMLIVLDNLEHLLASVDLLAEILEQAPAVKLLVTSRERLSLQGEWVFDLQGLSVPAKHQVDQLAEYGAIALFVDRARRVRKGFALAERNQRWVVQICRLVDGLPLGVEMAAAWVHVLSCQEIAKEIEQTIDFLTVSRRDVPERHRSLRATFDYSWRLLSHAEQCGLSELAIFRGSFTRDVAQQVAGASLALLASLVAKSLLLRADTGRYYFHQLVQQYAATKLAERAQIEPATSEALNINHRYATYFLNLALKAEIQLSGSEQLAWLDHIEHEHDNFRAVLDWAVTQHAHETGLRMAAALMPFWSMRDYIHEGRQQLLKQLEQPGASTPTLARANALNAASNLAYVDGDFQSVRALLDEALHIGQMLQDQSLLATTLHSAARTALLQADYGSARKFMEQSLALAQAMGNQNDICSLLIGLGDVALYQADYGQAQAVYEKGISLIRKSHGINLLAYALRQLGKAMLHTGEVGRAETLCQESLALNQAAHSKQGIIACVAGLAAIMIARQQFPRAVELCGAVEAQLGAITAHLLRPDQLEYERSVKTLRAELDEATLTAAWAKGRELTLEQAVAYALANQ